MRLPFAVLRLPVAMPAMRLQQRGKGDGDQRHAYWCVECEQWFGPFRIYRPRMSECHPDAGYAHHEVVAVRACPTCQRRLCYRAAQSRSPIEHLADGDHRPDPLFVVSG